MQLQWQCFLDGEDFWKVGEFAAKFPHHRRPHQVIALTIKDILEIFARFENERWKLGVCSHPPEALLEPHATANRQVLHFCIVLVLINLKVSAWLLRA